MDQLRSFTDGDKEEESLLVNLFADQAQISIKALASTLEEGNNDGWKSAAHRLKGSSGNLGAKKLSHLCKRAEMNAQAAPPDKKEMLEAISAELLRVQGYLSVSCGTAGNA